MGWSDAEILSGPAFCPNRLPVQLEPKLYLPFAGLRGAGKLAGGGDHIARAIEDLGFWRLEIGLVEQVESFYPDLEFTFSIDVEAAEDAGVDEGHARAAELVPVRVAEVRDEAKASDPGARSDRLYQVRFAILSQSAVPPSYLLCRQQLPVRRAGLPRRLRQFAPSAEPRC